MKTLKKALGVSLVTGMAVMGAVSPVLANTLEQNMFAYPNPIGVTRRVSVPKNANGSQGSEVFLININNVDIGGTYEIMFNSFVSITDINVAIYVGDDRVLGRRNVLPGDIIPFQIGNRNRVEIGTPLRVIVSSDTKGDVPIAGANMHIRSTADLWNRNFIEYLPDQMGNLAVTRTVSVPRNINQGNETFFTEGIEVFSVDINNSDIGGHYDIMFSGFTGMTDINVAVYIGAHRVIDRLNMPPGSVITPFSIGGNIPEGTSVRVVASSDNAYEGANAIMRIRPTNAFR